MTRRALLSASGARFQKGDVARQGHAACYSSGPSTRAIAMSSAFHRDPGLPFIESRLVTDGRKVCYAKHSHDTFSVGTIIGGRSRYLNGRRLHDVGAGSLVIMNPGEVHACNPLQNEPWAYRMLFVCTRWLASLQSDASGKTHTEMQPFNTQVTDTPYLYRGLNSLQDILLDRSATLLEKESAAVVYFTLLERSERGERRQPAAHFRTSRRVAEYLDEHFAQAIRLDDLCKVSGLSASHLIRSFKADYGLTPHRYLLDRRLRVGRSLLREGMSIAAAAAAAAFSDQAHFQREFKRSYGMTPGHYRGREAGSSPGRDSRH